MGIGMILWPIFFLSLLIAITIGIVLAIKIQGENKIRIETYGDTISFRRSPLIGLFSPLAVVFALCFLFMGYWVWCEGVLGEDPGFGDSWNVRLANGYSFTMIDTTETGFIKERDGYDTVNSIRRIGRQGDFLFGKKRNDALFEERYGDALPGGNRYAKPYFLLNMASKHLQQADSEAKFRAQCEAVGVNAESLLVPEAFYNPQRKWYLLPVPFIVLAGIVYLGIKIIKRIKADIAVA